MGFLPSFLASNACKDTAYRLDPSPRGLVLRGELGPDTPPKRLSVERALPDHEL